MELATQELTHLSLGDHVLFVEIRLGKQRLDNQVKKGRVTRLTKRTVIVEDEEAQNRTPQRLKFWTDKGSLTGFEITDGPPHKRRVICGVEMGQHKTAG